ncbi:AMP-binding enzyme [Microthyrium microscopicum]|uniref:AMP-binding enzyme n=1 Tax=Microthyrium microscopicum TaxID=703497 RepID=A0A6A6URD5_9PEZI|nr:AMP-binding enzyme [Microthyrium microscopicum]
MFRAVRRLMASNMDLLSWTFQNQSESDETPLLIDPSNTERSFSYSKLLSLTKQLIAGLKYAGITPGDCVLVNAFNDINYPVLYFGIVGTGAIFTGVNPSYTVDELAHHMRLTKPKAFIVEPDLLEKTIQAARDTGLDTNKMFTFDHSTPNTTSSIPSWTTLFNHGSQEWTPVPDPSQAIAQYASTSGTSGLPKAAAIPHTYHVSQAALLATNQPSSYSVRRLTALPPFHAFASPIVPASIHMRVPVYIMRRFDMSAFLAHLEQYQISETYLAPPVIVALAQHPGCTREALKSLRQIFYGGAPLKLANRLPLAELMDESAAIQPVWGMTETGWITCGHWGQQSADESVGWALDGFDAMRVDRDGLVGELVVKPPAPMLRYLQNEVATQETITEDGWVRTGDIGYVEAGKVFVVDRKKDIIKVRGWQVSPVEIEAVLLQHPDIQDVAVIGISEENGMGEIPKAFVVLKSGCDYQPELRDIQKFVHGKLAKYKAPQAIAFVDSIPKNPTGKIIRRNLRQWEERRAASDRLKEERRVADSWEFLFISSWLISVIVLVCCLMQRKALRRPAHHS